MDSSDLLFDVVICVGPNDNDIVGKVMPFTQKNVIGYRNIYLICSKINILQIILLANKRKKIPMHFFRRK